MEGVVATWGAVGLLLRDQKGSATEGGGGGGVEGGRGAAVRMASCRLRRSRSALQYVCVPVCVYMCVCVLACV
jgi:hypothetical protein